MSDPKTIVITGATRGLGHALTQEFIQLGHTVIGCGRSRERVEQMNQQFGPPHHFTAVDVADFSQVQRWAEQIFAVGPAPDFLINNAAIINRPGPLWEIEAAVFSDLVDINIKGVFHGIRAFGPGMIAHGKGVVINFSSGWGRSTSPEVAPYCASKYAIEGLSKAMAQEVPAAMAVVPLNPGVIATDMLRTCFGDAAENHLTAEIWARNAAPFILGIGPKDNGQSLSV